MQARAPFRLLVVCWALILFPTVIRAAYGFDRPVLPIPEPRYPPIKERDAPKAKLPPRLEVKAPSGAPNVVIVLIDDMGFGQSSVFGGEGGGTRRHFNSQGAAADGSFASPLHWGF